MKTIPVIETDRSTKKKRKKEISPLETPKEKRKA
jgi:hypothetical protein